MSYKVGYRTIAAFSIVLILAFITLDQIQPAGRRLAKVTGEDAVNYFGIAHSLLFDHDFNLTNEFEHVPPNDRRWTMPQKDTGLPGSPWGLGHSFLEMPLLIIGTGIDRLVGNPADGYSHWALALYCIGPMLMVAGGMLALFGLLCQLGSFWNIPQDRQVVYGLLVIVAVFAGTNVGYYAFSEMAHAATFLMATLFLAMWWRIRSSESSRDWLVLGLIGGLFSICRWQDLFYTGGPLLFDLFGGDITKKREPWWRSRLLYGLGVGVWWIPQVLEWKVIYGKYLTVPQGADIFSFPPQHALDVLFSTQGGWFIWTPVALLGVAGLLVGAVKAPRIFVPWLIVISLQVVLVGSISFWHGIESFGARYLLSNNAMAGLGLMTLFSLSGVMARRALAAACALCCIYTILFAIQFRWDLVPKATPLTFTELVTDKFQLFKVYERKQAVAQAQELLNSGDPMSAVDILKDAEQLGEDRDVDEYLAKAYQAAGKQELAEAVKSRRKAFLKSGFL
jgi:hypothetical protein